MFEGNLLTIFFLIFFGASVFATIALYTRQAIIIGYIALGLLLGPYGFKVVNDVNLIMDLSNIGIMFLLFLLGLNLNVKSLLNSIMKTMVVTLFSTMLLAGAIVSICYLFGIALFDSIIIGFALTFSSTIISLKLLPTTALHHRHIGDTVIGILLMQDILAILMLTMLGILGDDFKENTSALFVFAETLFSLFVVVVAGFVLEKYLISVLFKKFNRFSEYIFLLAIGWCLALAELAEFLGLPYEIGAFIAGVTLASSPIAQYIYESLKPLRDFFLIVFFFSVGAIFDIAEFSNIWIIAIIVSLSVLFLKPLLYWVSLSFYKSERKNATEVSVRLGQSSEFSLLVSFLILQFSMVSNTTSVIIQSVTIITFILSSSYVVLKFPTPIAISDKLRQD